MWLNVVSGCVYKTIPEEISELSKKVSIPTMNGPILICLEAR